MLWQKTQRFSYLLFYHFVKQKAENSCLINGHFKTISVHFLANYIDVFHKTEDQTVILRCLTCLYLNWIKSYDILLVKVVFFHACKCIISGVLCEVSFWYFRTKLALIFSKKLLQRLTIPRFKDFGIMHLKYEIWICAKNYNKFTRKHYFYYEIACIRR